MAILNVLKEKSTTIHIFRSQIHLQVIWNIPLSVLLILYVLPYLPVWTKPSSRNNASLIDYLRNIKGMSLSILFSYCIRGSGRGCIGSWKLLHVLHHQWSLEVKDSLSAEKNIGQVYYCIEQNPRKFLQYVLDDKTTLKSKREGKKIITLIYSDLEYIYSYPLSLICWYYTFSQIQ
jgi:hypothetical protein